MNAEQNTLDKILDAAATVFALKGFEGAKVQRIAEAAGVNKAALYYHVGNKGKLFEAVLTNSFNQAAKTLSAALTPESSPQEDLRRLVSALSGIFENNPVLPRLMIQEMIGGGTHLTPPVIERIIYMVKQTARILERGRVAGAFRQADPLLTHLSLIAPLSLFVLSGPIRQQAARAGLSGGVPLDRSVRDLAAHLADMIVLALRPEDSEGEKI